MSNEPHSVNGIFPMAWCRAALTIPLFALLIPPDAPCSVLQDSVTQVTSPLGGVEVGYQVTVTCDRGTQVTISTDIDGCDVVINASSPPDGG